VNLSVNDRRTLQLGPLWVLSALAGTHNRFHPAEIEAFWDTVVAVALRTPQEAREILTSMAEDRRSLVHDFARDDRPVVSGLAHVVALLDRMAPTTAEDFKLALLRIGMGVARARGPYGRIITPENEQMLLLLAELLEIEQVPEIQDEILV
jgi:hypothetical protein